MWYVYIWLGLYPSLITDACITEYSVNIWPFHGHFYWVIWNSKLFKGFHVIRVDSIEFLSLFYWITDKDIYKRNISSYCMYIWYLYNLYLYHVKWIVYCIVCSTSLFCLFYFVLLLISFSYLRASSSFNIESKRRMVKDWLWIFKEHSFFIKIHSELIFYHDE
jgi:hypothetical protein